MFRNVLLMPFKCDEKRLTDGTWEQRFVIRTLEVLQLTFDYYEFQFFQV